MSISIATWYDDVPVYLCGGVESEDSPAASDVAKYLSVAWVSAQNATKRDDFRATVSFIVGVEPVLVHCFGASGEAMHDAIDAALHAAGSDGTVTYWTRAFSTADVIFEFFRTDLPACGDLDKWGGRLIFLDKNIDPDDRQAVIQHLTDVDGVIRGLLEKR